MDTSSQTHIEGVNEGVSELQISGRDMRAIEKQKKTRKTLTNEQLLDSVERNRQKSYENKRAQYDKIQMEKYGEVPERAKYTRIVPLLSDEERLKSVQRNRDNARERYRMKKMLQLQNKEPVSV